MNQFPTREEFVSPINSPQTPHYHVSHQLCTVPEDETLNCTEFRSVQRSPSTICDGSNRGIPSFTTRDYTCSSKYSRGEEAAEWFADERQKPADQGRRRQITRWTTPARLVLLVLNLATSIAIFALLLQALLSHQKLRHIRQFNGADDAWPKHMSLASTTVLLFVAGTSMAKTATLLVADFLYGTRARSNMFLLVMTACAALMAAAWVATIVFVELNKQDNENFVSWTCARSDAAANQIVPYGTICNGETVASQLAVVVLVIEMLLGIGSAIMVILNKFHPAKR